MTEEMMFISQKIYPDLEKLRSKLNEALSERRKCIRALEITRDFCEIEDMNALLNSLLGLQIEIGVLALEFAYTASHLELSDEFDLIVEWSESNLREMGDEDAKWFKEYEKRLLI